MPLLVSLKWFDRPALENYQFACGVFIDPQKTFDTVDLLSKMNHYGIKDISYE